MLLGSLLHVGGRGLFVLLAFFFVSFEFFDLFHLFVLVHCIPASTLQWQPLRHKNVRPEGSNLVAWAQGCAPNAPLPFLA